MTTKPQGPWEIIRMISCAPEMLEQLKFCLALIEDEDLDELHGDLAECVRDVIAKAEGRRP